MSSYFIKSLEHYFTYSKLYVEVSKMANMLRHTHK